MIENFFKFNATFIKYIKTLADFPPGSLQNVVHNRSYGRRTDEGYMESFPETMLRVIEGNISIRKDFSIKMGLDWSEEYWQEFGQNSTLSAIDLKWLPGGRHIWMSGTDSRTRGWLSCSGTVSSRRST